nr:xylulose kinase-1 [Tanacetum cinerariifolium]
MSDDDSLVNSVHEGDAPEQKGNSQKNITSDTEGNIIIAPPVTVEEHMQVQREEKARTMLLTTLPDDHMGDFYHMIDAKQIWSAIKARFGRNAESTKIRRSLLKHQFEEYKASEEEGLDGGYDKMHKILSKMNTLKIKPDQEDINMKEAARFDKKLAKCFKCKKTGHFARECRSQVSQESTNYKNYKKKEAAKEAPESLALVVIDGSQGVNWDKQLQENTTEPGVLGNYGFVAEKGTNSTIPTDDDVPADAVPGNAFISAEPTIPADRVIAAIDGIPADSEFAMMSLPSKVSLPFMCPLCNDAKSKLTEPDYQAQREQLNDCVVNLKAHKNVVKTLEKQIKCHQKNQTAYEEKIRVLSFEVEKQTNMVSYKKKLLNQASVKKQDLMATLENEKSINAKWISTSKNLHKFGGNAESTRMRRSLLKHQFEEYKAFEVEGLDGGYDKMQKILSKMNTLKIKPDQEDINMKFLRGLPPSWANIAQIMKVKGGLEYMSLDDLYNKLKCLEIDTKCYSVPASALANAAFVSSSCSSSSRSKLSYQETNSGGSSAKHSASKGSSSTQSSAIDDFSREAARFDKKLAKCFKCKKTGHFARKCRSQVSKESTNYKNYKKKEAAKEASESSALVVIDGSQGTNSTVPADDVVPANAFISAEPTIPADRVIAAVDGIPADSEFAMMSLPSKYFKNLHKLVDSSMTARTKKGLGYVNLTGENDWGFGDSKLSVFNSNKEDWEGKPIYNRFTKVNHYKGVPPPMNGNYMPTFTSPDTDESPRPYGKQTSESTKIKSTSKNSNFPFDFSNRSSVPTASDSCVESARPNNVVNDSEDFTSRTSTSGSEEQVNNDTISNLNIAKDTGIADSGCSRSMSGNRDKLDDFVD